MKRIQRTNGYSLIELIVVIIIIGILAGVTMGSLRSANDTVRIEETKRELELLAQAIVGTPDQVSNGVRTSYGYVGDIGALPTALDALMTNPGGWSAWKGPYLVDPLTYGGSSGEFKNDAWGKPYTLSGVTISSTGSSFTITRALGKDLAALTSNTVTATITDIKRNCPGADYKDSVRFILTYPNGTGGMTTSSRYPSADGSVQFAAVPMGLHQLMAVYIPTGDTLTRRINVEPGQGYHGDFMLPREAW